MNKLISFIQKLLIMVGLLSIFATTIILNKFTIIKYINKFTNGANTEILNNKYAKDTKYNYISNTDNLIPKNKQDLLNLYYTFINSGMETFNFTCDNNYTNCLKDLDIISKDQKTLSALNSFVHPYNSFTEIKTSSNLLGNVTLTSKKAYTQSEIYRLNQEIEKIDKEVIKGEKDPRKIITLLHDYIIKNTDYEEKENSPYKVNIAYGSLIQGKALCGGYTYALALFLDYYKIPNFKVTSKEHTWNAVKINNTWYHVDLTWDDPVVPIPRVFKTFLFLSTDELLKKDDKQHNFDTNIYSELK